MNPPETRVPPRKTKPKLPKLSIALLLVTLCAPAVRAAELTPTQKLEMKQLYERATRAYDVGKYNEAIEEYQKAYEIGGDPPMLYNIAQAYRLNDQPGEALRFYRRYLQRAPNARNREDVERKIADLEKSMEEHRKAAAAATPPPVTAPPLTPAPATPGRARADAAGPPAPAARGAAASDHLLACQRDADARDARAFQRRAADPGVFVPGRGRAVRRGRPDGRPDRAREIQRRQQHVGDDAQHSFRSRDPALGAGRQRLGDRPRRRGGSARGRGRDPRAHGRQLADERLDDTRDTAAADAERDGGAVARQRPRRRGGGFPFLAL